MAVSDILYIDPAPKTGSLYYDMWRADRKERALYLARGLKRSTTDFDTVLFFYLVQEFEKKPTKSKFQFIYDEVFLTKIKEMNYAIDLKRGLKPKKLRTSDGVLGRWTIDLNFSFTFTNLHLLKMAAETVGVLSATAKSMSLFKRLSTSSSRKIPGYLFNQLAAELTQTRPEDTYAKKWGLNTKTESPFENMGIFDGHLDKADGNHIKNLEEIQKDLCKRLKKAGFSTRELGIDGIKERIYSVKVA